MSEGVLKSQYRWLPAGFTVLYDFNKGSMVDDNHVVLVFNYFSNAPSDTFLAR
jgi:hypothetical protein